MYCRYCTTDSTLSKLELISDSILVCIICILYDMNMVARKITIREREREMELTDGASIIIVVKLVDGLGWRVDVVEGLAIMTPSHPVGDGHL